MHDLPLVQMRDCEDDLCEVEARELLAERALAVELEEEVAAVDEVEEEIQLRAGLYRGDDQQGLERLTYK